MLSTHKSAQPRDGTLCIAEVNARLHGNATPIPDDLPQLAGIKTQEALASHYGVSKGLVARWLSNAGLKSAGLPKAPVPDDFAAMARGMSQIALCRHYRRDRKTVVRWLAETGTTYARNTRKKSVAKPPPPVNLRPVPDDFAARAPIMTRSAMRGYYSAASTTIARWLAETGISPRTVDYRPTRGAAGTNLSGVRVKSIYDDAADALRREHFAVYRCDDRGVADFKGAFWRVGNTLNTPSELLGRAARYQEAR